MDEIWRSNSRTGNICDLTVVGVAIVSMAATVGAPLLYWYTGIVWLSAGAPLSVIIAAVAAAMFIQGRAVRQHEALCASFVAGLRL